jgi:hypothetical protein
MLGVIEVSELVNEKIFESHLVLPR